MPPAAERDPSARLAERLLELGGVMVDQKAGRVIVAAERPARGYWFGGGNMVRLPDGRLCLVGRYRNAGDSRTGLDLGDRGRELAIFVSGDRGLRWTKVLGLGKERLRSQGSAGSDDAKAVAVGADVLSIEGAALRVLKDGVELYVSSEKRIPYPESVDGYCKPGTGVWTIERLHAASIEALADAKPLTILASRDPRALHLKDPFLYELDGGRLLLLFCHHPFSWSSSNTGAVVIDPAGSFLAPPRFDLLPRGTTWDVAITRGTCLIDLPRPPAAAGLASSGGRDRLGLVFYDGGESLRKFDEHARAVSRPRGYSCEELGGLGYFRAGDPATFGRLSSLFPAFVSPHGSGSSRYVDVLCTGEDYFVTWQQAQEDGSQPLVMNVVGRDRLESFLD